MVLTWGVGGPEVHLCRLSCRTVAVRAGSYLMLTSMLKDMLVVDADSHWCEPPDLFTKRAPDAFKHRVPRVEEVEGQLMWVFDGHPVGRFSAGGVIARDGSKESSFRALMEWDHDQVHLGAHDPEVRLGVLDECGIDAQIIFPSTIGLGGQDLGMVDDPALCRLAIEIYNDGMAEIQADSGNRLLPLPLMPAWDVATCVQEARRVSALGARGVNMTSDPQDLGAPDLANQAWDPLWEACSELSPPVHFTAARARRRLTSFGRTPWARPPGNTRM